MDIDSLGAKFLSLDDTFSIQIPYTFSIFNGFATVGNFEISALAKTQWLASMTLSIPDLNMQDARCSLAVDVPSGNYTFMVTGRATFLFNAVTMEALTISIYTKGRTVRGEAVGTLGGYRGSLAFSFSLKSKNSTVPTPPATFALAIPSVNVGSVMRAIGPSAADLLPSFLTDAELPSLRVATYSTNTTSTNTSNIYRITVGPHATSGIYADFIFDQQGVLTANVTMSKALDLGAAVTAALPGVSLPFDVKGIIIIREPYLGVVSSRAPARGVAPAGAKTGTVMGFGLQVPAILGDSTVFANMMLMDGNKTRVNTFEIGWTGNFSPVQYVTLRGALLRIQSGQGVTVMANGTLVSVDVAVVLQLTGGKSFTLSAEARNIVAANILKTLFPSTPALVLKVLEPVRFSYISFTWNGQFGCEASPDLSSVAGLKDLISFLQFKQEDIKIRPKLNEMAIEIAIAKTWELTIGNPFIGSSILSFALALSQSGANTQFAASADFRSQIRLSFLEPEVIWMSLGATVAYDSLAPPPSVSFSIRAAVSATTNPFYIKGFPWIKIAYLGGEVGLTPMAAAPFVSLYKISFLANASVLSTNVNVALLWDQPKADFGVQFTINNFNLQSMMNEMGIRASLGPFNIAIKTARFSFARQPIALPSGGTIPAGLKFAGDLTFLTIGFNFDITVDTSGFDLYVEARDVLRSGIFGAIFDSAQSVIDKLGFNINIRDQVKVDYVRVRLSLKTSGVVIKFGLKAYFFGITLDLDIGLDTSNAPWDAIVKTLTDKFVEPLTAACTKDSYTRGSRFVDSCPAGRERQGDFCYPNCPTDWQYGVSGKLNICYQNCPPGYRDDGIGGTGLTCSTVTCNPGEIWDGALLCWAGCRSGYSYLATRCYKNCQSGWSDDPAGMSCTIWACDPGDEDNGAGLCYPACRSGYTSNKLTLCIQSSCPSGYRNDPLSCWRDVHIYGKGCCCIYWFGWRCCGCGGGYKDDGCTCRRNCDLIWKSIYDRGVGYTKFRMRIKESYMNSAVSAVRSFVKKTQWRDTYPMVCKANTDYDGLALCYDYCNPGYTSVLFVCWQNCPSNKGLIDCGSYCAPRAAGSCANFIGATYQNCKNKYPQRRMVLDMLLSGNYTEEQISAAAAGDYSVFKGSAWDPKSVEVIHYTSHTGRDAAAHAGLLHPETTRIPKTAGRLHAEYTNSDDEGWEEVEVNDDPHYEGFSTVDSWEHVRIMHEPKEDDVIPEQSFGFGEDEGSGVRVVRMLQTAAGAGCKVTDTTPECWCVGKAYDIYADPAGNKNRYLICGGNVGLLKSCPAGKVYSPDRRLCVSPSDATAPSPPPPGSGPQKPPLPPKTCMGRDDGIYFQDSRDNTTAYKCESGEIVLKFCGEGLTLDEATGECKEPEYKPPGQMATCRDPDCFCTDKKNGNYSDVIRGNVRRYISCRGGKGRWRKCEKDFVFNVVTLTCGFLPPNATVPIKGCKSVDCYCVGRADGVYVNPWSNSTGISCSFQTHALIECAEGFEFVITKQPFCQPIDPDNPFIRGVPPMPPGASTTPMAPPEGPGHRRSRRRGV